MGYPKKILNRIIKNELQNNGNTINRSEESSESHIKIFFNLSSGETAEGIVNILCIKNSIGPLKKKYKRSLQQIIKLKKCLFFEN